MPAKELASVPAIMASAFGKLNLERRARLLGRDDSAWRIGCGDHDQAPVGSARLEPGIVHQEMKWNRAGSTADDGSARNA
jgi:hypothetical protein